MASVEAVCHCGAVRIVVPGSPETVTTCNCTICHAYGALWAYYTESEVVMPATQVTHEYSHGDKMIAFHRCSVCGCTTHWVGATAAPPGGDRKMAINARLLPREILQSATVRALDGLDTWKVLDLDFKWSYCPTQSVLAATCPSQERKPAM